ncbi:Wzz/FepE/Etk N-terminal domain-containing protein, partial [Acinetobacter baumannii]|uniref:Wzz/FepE/Etk N-terminal domain-containing protein n=1 Tax=Acinetobacter baumannii TaxID=470 RepID=UPI0021014007
MSQTSKTEDTIDLKELFFSLIAQWKLIVLCILISLVCALIYLRVTPNTYSVDALVQVEDTKSAASAALLGELSKMVDQKSPAEAEIQVLTSRMVLGQVIHNLNLDITIKNHDDTCFTRFLTKYTQKIHNTKHPVIE